MKKYRTLDIISATLFQTELNLKKDYLSFFKKLKYKRSNIPRRTGISVEQNLFQKYPKELKELRKEITISLKEVIKNYYMYDCDFRITNSWATVANSFEGSEMHIHSNSWLTGCYYPQGNNTISVENVNNSSFLGDPKEYNLYNSKGFDLTTHKNTLLIFPSHLYHRIPAEDLNGKTRHSFALNVLPKGDFGVEDSKVNF